MGIDVVHDLGKLLIPDPKEPIQPPQLKDYNIEKWLKENKKELERWSSRLLKATYGHTKESPVHIAGKDA